MRFAAGARERAISSTLVRGAGWGLGVTHLERGDLRSATQELSFANELLAETSLASHGLAMAAFLGVVLVDDQPAEARGLLDRCAAEIESAPAEMYRKAIETLVAARKLIQARSADEEMRARLRAELGAHLRNSDRAWSLTRIAAKVLHDAVARYDAMPAAGSASCSFGMVRATD